MRFLAAVLLLTLLAPVGAGAQDAPVAPGSDTAVVVRVDVPIGESNAALAGVGWNAGAIEDLGELRPPQVRIDASLQRASRGPDDLDLGDVKAKAERLRARGAEPLVILSYMPAWLGEPRAAGRDPTRVAPSDLDVWEALVERVVRELATHAAPVHRFEVWNEPDVPIFWQDSLGAFLDMAVRTHRAVARVDADLDADLHIAGPATAFPDPAWIGPYLSRIRDERLPLDALSWHYYGNYPFLGPDGAEGIVPGPIQPALLVWGQRNPATTPTWYRHQTEGVRLLSDALLAGSGLDPELWITEWNLSAGGLDHRHDSHVGAAFHTAVLIELERARLDAADFYRAIDDAADDRPGQWGLVAADGTRKPSWWVLRAWELTDGDRLAVWGDEPEAGLWARATTEAGTVDVLLVNFVATGGASRRVALTVDGACVDEASIRRLGPGSASFGSASPGTADGGELVVELPPSSVAWVSYETC